MAKPKVIKAWGGFVDDELDVSHTFQYLSEEPRSLWLWSVYQTREDARQHYADVRRVEIREVPTGRRKGKRR